jgi:succinate-semialdehyde dehydrogenase / glutarate-semialdehyde dehydrogenase
MATRKIAPALAAGCTVILKPAELTPLTSLVLGRLLLEAGVPAGVVNIVPTSTPGALSEPIIRDPRTRKLTFTGSTNVGRRLIEQGAQQVLRVSMELGGNAPFIVCEDADLDKPSMARCWPRCAITAKPAPPPTAFSCTLLLPPSSRDGSVNA